MLAYVHETLRNYCNAIRFVAFVSILISSKVWSMSIAKTIYCCQKPIEMAKVILQVNGLLANRINNFIFSWPHDSMDLGASFKYFV